MRYSLAFLTAVLILGGTIVYGAGIEEFSVKDEGSLVRVVARRPNVSTTVYLIEKNTVTFLKLHEKVAGGADVVIAFTHTPSPLEFHFTAVNVDEAKRLFRLLSEYLAKER